MSASAKIIRNSERVLEQLRQWPQGAGVLALSAVVDLSEEDCMHALAYLLGAARVIDTSDDAKNYRWIVVSA